MIPPSQQERAVDDYPGFMRRRVNLIRAADQHIGGHRADREPAE